MSKKSPKVEEVEVEVIGPGCLLSEARIANGLSVDDIANRLNFRVTLVQNIETDTFDKTLPDTYNRGYLKNYAKLVNVSIPEVIERYEKISLFQENSSQMQSFSRGTMKKAENSLLMWITYIILAIFIGFTVMWWIQEDKAATPQSNTLSTIEMAPEKIETDNSHDAQKSIESKVAVDNLIKSTTTEHVPVINELLNTETSDTVIDSNNGVTAVINTDIGSDVSVVEPEESTLTKVIFTFAGDCWVNIYDALGERIAWGIKKSGYVMTIDAKTPLKITIGKPELVNITFDGEGVDMSTFPKGHIAKFDLPLLPQS